MFVRVQEVYRRLWFKLVETRRLGGKFRQEHIASLGSIPIRHDIADRVAFWQRIHERLAKLANRVSADDTGKIMGAIHARVPMPTPDEQRALQLENAVADERLYDALADMHAEAAVDHRGLMSAMESRIAKTQAAIAEMAASVAAARDRMIASRQRPK